MNSQKQQLSSHGVILGENLIAIGERESARSFNPNENAILNIRQEFEEKGHTHDR
jgi:hypothetical protein